MNRSIRLIKTALLSTLIMGVTGIFAQSSFNSPYSKFGLGFQNNTNGAFFSSMGGLSYGVSEKNYINSNNPASYISTDSGRFVFNTSFTGYYSTLKTSDFTHNSSYGNIESFKFAFPVTNWMKMSFGLKPFSSKAYETTSSETIYSNQGDSVATAVYDYVGSGGINQFYLGSSVKIIDNLSVGANASFLFGKISDYQNSGLKDEPFAYNYRLRNNYNINSLYFDYGLQYKLNLKDDKSFTFGMAYSQEQKIKFTNTVEGITYTASSTDFETHYDTLLNNETQKLSFTYPSYVGGGISFAIKNKLLIGVDAKFQEWSKFVNPLYDETLKNSTKFSFGGYYQLNRAKILFGANYEESMLSINNTDINNIGISFGVNLPLRIRNQPYSYGYIDLGVEYLRTGTTESNLIQQDYIRFFVGISIENEWFKKPKYQ